jgi:hypothetical protein
VAGSGISFSVTRKIGNMRGLIRKRMGE